MMRCIFVPSIFAVSLVLLLGGSASAQDRGQNDPCNSREARLLAADAKRASQWNWGWGIVYAGASLGQGGVAMWTDNEDLKVSLWTGAAKSTLGVLNQIIFPKRISAPGPGCNNLAKKLRKARRVERWGHNWFAHGSVIAANVAGFAIVAGVTENYVLATSGTIVGSIVGEIAIYTSPNKLRAAGLGIDRVGLVPHLGIDYSGLSLLGTF